MIDVVALGELLIDFAARSTDPAGYPTMAANPGGAPGNFLAALNAYGKKTAFLGKVGNDAFGQLLCNTLRTAGIETKGILVDDSVFTTLAFVTFDEKGDRSFDFYRTNSADVMLRKEEVPVELLRSSRIFHFGSVSMTAEPTRDATLYAARRAKELGALISYDPNFRPALWSDREEAIRVMRTGLAFADIVKVSDEEVELLTGHKDYLAGARALVDTGAKLALVTAGEQGTWYASASGDAGHVPSITVNAIDTTGAGDTFLGALLSELLDCGESLEQLSAEKLREIIRFANAAGALCTTGRGAIASMPKREQILHCLEGEEKG